MNKQPKVKIIKQWIFSTLIGYDNYLQYIILNYFEVFLGIQ